MSSLTIVEGARKAAAYRAVEDHLDPTFRYVGIGSGRTVVYVVDAIVAKGPAFFSHMHFIPTSSQSRRLIVAGGLPLCELNERALDAQGAPVSLDVAFDGADQVDERMNCIKGGGACLFQEKLVSTVAKKFVVVVDYAKLVPRLCSNDRSIPLEVLPLAAPDILGRLRAVGCLSAAIRAGAPGQSGPWVTDNGMWLIDAQFSPLLLSADVAAKSGAPPGSWEVNALAKTLVGIPGIVETGLFCSDDHGDPAQPWLAQKPTIVYVGKREGGFHVLSDSESPPSQEKVAVEATEPSFLQK